MLNQVLTSEREGQRSLPSGPKDLAPSDTANG
jgi:hypothetical protein